MNFYLVIPAHNEENYIAQTLGSLVQQSLLPKRIVVVNDHSTDNTQNIIESFAQEHRFISSISITSEATHRPGSKVISAFHKGLEQLDDEYDVICKFDADLIFPPNYLEEMANIFRNNPRCGMAGGYCYIEKNGDWILESLTNKDHIRGALKAYRKSCFEQIGGLKNAMGWDTIDELLAQFNGWEVRTNENLHVKHLKPTGTAYLREAGFKQGIAFKQMRYGFWLTLIAATKLAVKKRSIRYWLQCLKGFFAADEKYLVTPTEGKFIRSLRWRNIRKKLS